MQAPQDASPEIQEILKELEAEGKGSVEGKPSAPPEPEPQAPKPEEPKPEAQKPEDADPKKPADPAKNDNIDRTGRFVPVKTHNEERHKRQEAENAAKEAREEAERLRAQLASASGKPEGNNGNDDDFADIRKFADDNGVDPDFAVGLAKAIAAKNPGKAVLPPEIAEQLKSLEGLKQVQEQAQAIVHAQKQDAAFDNEFAAVTQEFPDLAGSKEALKQLAFSDGNLNAPLRLLALGYMHDNPQRPGRKTAESPLQGKRDTTEVVDFAAMTEEQFKGLNEEQFTQYEAWLTKNPRR